MTNGTAYAIIILLLVNIGISAWLAGGINRLASKIRR